MSEYSLSPLAELDLVDMAGYTTDIWSLEQATGYLDGLFACFERIVLHSGLGRRCDSLRPELGRMEEGKHVIFSTSVASGVIIVRILHHSMLPTRHDLLDVTRKQSQPSA